MFEFSLSWPPAVCMEAFSYKQLVLIATHCHVTIELVKYPILLHILLHKSKYGYNASVPIFPGCHSQGKSEREALANIKDAIRVYLTMEGQELGAVRLREVEVSLA